jgi:hypothetical protein
MRRLVLGVLLLTGLAMPRLADAGAITFSTALPVAEGQGVLRLQMIGARASGDPTALDRELRVNALGVVFAYGVTSKWTLFAAVPVLNLRLDLNPPSGRVVRNASGVGDLRLLARYTVFQRDEPGKTLRLAPFVGLEAPTGADDRGDDLGLLPPPVQPGSGSWDAVAGIALTRQTLGWEADASVAYTVSGSGDWFDLGDEARFDLSYQHRIAPRELGGGVPAFLYAVLESNLVWRGRTVVVGVSNPASGGTTWFLSPGLQYVTRRLVVEGVIQIPVVQNLGPGALDMDWVVRAGVRVYL